MHTQHPTLSRLLTCTALCVLATLPMTGEASWYGPETFRREHIEGRDFTYNYEAFINRFSFDPLPALQPQQRFPRDGIFGIGGSTRSRELYVRQQIQLSVPTDNAAYIGYRFFRSEDFDGRFDQQLLGIGVRQENWQFVFWGDAIADKSETDMQFELIIRPDNRDYVRLILAAPDAIYNNKNLSGDDYLRLPITGYLSSYTSLSPQHAVYSFINWNRRTRFFSNTFDLTLDDEHLSGGLGLLWTPADWIAGLELEASRTDRLIDGRNPDNPKQLDLGRRFYQATLEVRAPDPNSQWWLGVRHLNFDEENLSPNNARNWPEEHRQETYLYAGQRWSLTDRLDMSLTIIAGYAEVHQQYSLAPERDLNERGFIGKLVPAFSFSMLKDRNAIIVVNPTLYLHKAGFGGGNVQMQMPL